MHQEVTLSNGLRVLMVPMPSLQSVSIGVFIKIGSRYERLAQSGISHFIEHMLFKGTHQLPSARLIAEAIEGIGGDSNAYTSVETTVFYAKVAASQVDFALAYLADLLRHSLFSPADIEKERRIIGEEISMVYDSPDEWLEVLTDQVIWPNHPLGQAITGTPESLATFTRASLLAFFERGYHPGNAIIAVGGAFNPDQLVAQINGLWGDWETSQAPDFMPAPQLRHQPTWQIEDRAIEQGHLCLALPGLPRQHPDRYALSLLSTILGDGMSSRLFQVIREDKGLAYAVDSSLTFLQDTGTLTIYAGVDPDRAEEALQAILTEVERLRLDLPTDAEIERAKAYLKGRLVLGLEDSYSRAAWVAYQALFMDKIRSPEEVLAAYDLVSAADVRAVAQAILDPAFYRLAAVGPFGQGQELAELLV
ncbi:MAG TPA: pitrilysin family protein [Anaerolineae bacterium]|nr:pitrilysin family protein [Anaerolineae bacterium]HMR66301.1 pitrilysin family protein [Anaerolineae bacterium]